MSPDAVSPRFYSDPERLAIVEEICDRYGSSCLSVAQIVNSDPDRYPRLQTLWKWETGSPSIAEMMGLARVRHAHFLAHEALQIADNTRDLLKEKQRTCQKCGGLGRADECEHCGGTGRHPERPESWVCGKCKCRSCAGKGYWLERTIMDNVERADLQVKTRQWLAARLDPATFSERQQIDINVKTEGELRQRLMAARSRVVDVESHAELPPGNGTPR